MKIIWSLKQINSNNYHMLAFRLHNCFSLSLPSSRCLSFNSMNIQHPVIQSSTYQPVSCVYRINLVTHLKGELEVRTPTILNYGPRECPKMLQNVQEGRILAFMRV